MWYFKNTIQLRISWADWYHHPQVAIEHYVNIRGKKIS